MVTVRAIYKDGAFHPLDPVDVKEGEQVQLRLETVSEEVLRVVLSDLNIQWPDPDAFVGDDVDEAALMREIQAGFKGARSLSEIIIEERGEGL
jgi:predicted DNA-binding antitoxin AbrB/MazE fold protein